MLYEEDIMVAEPNVDEYQNPAVTEIAPEGCVSVEDFFADIKQHIDEFCSENSQHI